MKFVKICDHPQPPLRRRQQVDDDNDSGRHPAARNEMLSDRNYSGIPRFTMYVCIVYYIIVR